MLSRPTLTSAELAIWVKALPKAGQVVAHDEATDPNKLLGRPGQYRGKANWSQGGVECSVEAFDNPKDLRARADYITTTGEKLSLALQYVTTHFRARALLHCDHAMLPSEHKKLELAFLQAF